MPEGRLPAHPLRRNFGCTARWSMNGRTFFPARASITAANSYVELTVIIKAQNKNTETQNIGTRT